jgi:L-rhamnose isomerase
MELPALSALGEYAVAALTAVAGFVVGAKRMQKSMVSANLDIARDRAEMNLIETIQNRLQVFEEKNNELVEELERLRLENHRMRMESERMMKEIQALRRFIEEQFRVP